MDVFIDTVPPAERFPYPAFFCSVEKLCRCRLLVLKKPFGLSSGNSGATLFVPDGGTPSPRLSFLPRFHLFFPKIVLCSSQMLSIVAASSSLTDFFTGAPCTTKRIFHFLSAISFTRCLVVLGLFLITPTLSFPFSDSFFLSFLLTVDPSLPHNFLLTVPY